MILELIKIKNYALIEDSEIELRPGLNIISGETGSGKSLFINALSLIVGEKVENDIVGKHGDEAVIEAILKSDKILKKIKKLELPAEEDTIIIKRVFGKKNRCYINDALVSVAQLKSIMREHIDICSQHDNQSILKESVQTELLDHYAKCSDQVQELKELFTSWKKSDQERTVKIKEKDEVEAKLDFIQFQLEEIRKVNPQESDSGILEKISALKNSEEINETKRIISEHTETLRSLVQNLFFELKILDKMTSANSSEEFKELSGKLKDFIASLDLDPAMGDEEEMAILLDRSEKLNKLIKKHGGSLTGLIEAKEKLEGQVDLSDNFDKVISELEKKASGSKKKYDKLASEVSELRKKAAATLSKKIENQLKELKMGSVKFEISIEDSEPSENGSDRIEFLISPNLGEELKPINKIASGGELSRILLSVYNVLSKSEMAYLFDEVDAGIGGETGTKVGLKLLSMAKNNQVICITHLAQVAAFGEANYVISKEEIKNKTVSRIKELNEELKELEIARMLGSSENKQTAIAHAKELIKKAK